MTGSPKLIEVAEINSPAMGKQLLVERNRVGLRADEIKRQLRVRQPAINSSGFFCASASGVRLRIAPSCGVSASAASPPVPRRRPKLRAPAGAPGRSNTPRREFERPDRDVAAQPIAARDLPVELAKAGVEIGAARDRTALAQRRVAKRRDALTSIIDGVGAR